MGSMADMQKGCHNLKFTARSRTRSGNNVDSGLQTVLFVHIPPKIRKAVLSVCIVTYGGLLLPTSYGQQTSAAMTGRVIREVQLVPATALQDEDLKRSQPLRVGDPFQPDDAARAIDSLYATGRFEDISVELEAEQAGVRVRIVTKPRWFVGGVTVRGKMTPPPNRGQLAASGPFTLGAPFQEEDLNTALESIKALLSANGLYEAVVAPSVRRDPDAQQVFISFQVSEGKRAKYEQPVLHGDTTLLSEGTILRATGWRIPLIHIWRHVTDNRTRSGIQDIQSKYQGKDRLSAKVELEKLEYNAETRRVQPTLNLEPGPKVIVKASGAKVSKKILKRYVPVYEERAAYTDLLVEGKRNLQDYFQSRGYYDVEVDFRSSPVENDVETIDYVIERGERYKLKHLEIVGNRYFNDESIRERMFITPASFSVWRGRYSEAFRRKDEDNIRNLYTSNGFHDVKVSATVERDYKGKEGDFAVTVNIDEGPQWLVDHVTLTGVQQLPREQVVSQLTSLEGQPFAEASLMRDRSTVLSYYFSRGFPDADMKVEWTASETPQHTNVTYTVQEGRGQYVRDVLVSGLRTTRQSIVDHRMTLKPGDPLSPVEQASIQKKFYDMGVFARVDTAIENSEGDTDHKYVLYNFEEAARYNVAFGLGAQVGRFGTPSTSSLSNPGGQNGFSPDVSLDVNRLNFLGKGHTVSFRGHYSTIERRASLSYLQPRFQNTEGRNLTYNLLYEDTLNVRTFSSKRQEASVQISQQFTKTLTGLFRVSYRRVSITDVIIPVLLVPQLVQPVRLGMISANFSHDRRDNASDPHRGVFNTFDVGLSTKYFVSERSFARVLGRNATYHRLSRTVVLARQTQFGLILPFAPPAGISAEQSVPLPERFFGGGADSLRAFAFNQAGPRDTGAALVEGGPTSQPTGFPLGGNALFFNNVELRFPLLGQNVQGVLFHDMGNVFSRIGNVSFRFKQKDLQDFDYTVHAVGFGIRYKTPVGPIRGDLAYSINPPSFNGFNGTPQQLLQCNPSMPNPSLPYCTPSRQSIGHIQFFFSIGQTF